MDASDPTLTGTFTSDKVKALLQAFNCLSKVGIEKVALEFCDNKLKINAVNNLGTVLASLNFDSFFLVDFVIKKDFEYGVYNLSDLIGLLELFKNGFNIKMSPELASISSDDNYLDYYGMDTSRTSKINRKPEGDFEAELLASIKCDDSFKSFMDSMGRLPHEDIIFKSVPLQNCINMSVADKTIKGNNFTKKINIEGLKSDFRVVVKKEFFKNVITTNTELQIYREAIRVKRVDNLFNIEYFVKTLI